MSPSDSKSAPHAVLASSMYDLHRKCALPKPQWEFPRLCRGGSKSLTFQEVESTGPIVEALNREPPSTRKELHRWMMMEIKAHQVEVANSSYRSLPSCGGTALGEAFTEWREA